MDRFILIMTEIIKKVPKLPDKIEWYFVYLIASILSFYLVYNADLGLFALFGIHFEYRSIDYILTALFISNDSSFITENLSNIIGKGFLGSLSGIKTSMFSKKSKKDNHNDIP